MKVLFCRISIRLLDQEQRLGAGASDLDTPYEFRKIVKLQFKGTSQIVQYYFSMDLVFGFSMLIVNLKFGHWIHQIISLKFAGFWICTYWISFAASNE